MKVRGRMPRRARIPIKLECPKVSYVQVYVWPSCRRTSTVSVCVVRACAILSFYNSRTSYELSFLGIGNFGFTFFFSMFLLLAVCARFHDVRWRCGNKFSADLLFPVCALCCWVQRGSRANGKGFYTKVEYLWRQLIISHRPDYNFFFIFTLFGLPFTGSRSVRFTVNAK